jgi:hypothetical protein
MLQQKDRVGMDPKARVEWRQTAVERVVTVTGLIDEPRAHHLENGLIGLGDRRLVLDLTGALFADTLDALTVLSGLRHRLGRRPLQVMAAPGLRDSLLPAGFDVRG